MTGAAYLAVARRRRVGAVRALQRVAVAISAQWARRRKLLVRITLPLICCVLDESCRSLVRRKASKYLELNNHPVLATCNTLASTILGAKPFGLDVTLPGGVFKTGDE